MTAITPSDLQHSYFEATNKLIPLLQYLRGESPSLKLNDLKSLFSHSTLWISSKQRSGHKKYHHKVTQIVIDQGHGDNTVKKHIQDQILTQLQKHVNFFATTSFIIRSITGKPNPIIKEPCKI
jgi:hypothetical protein